MSDAVTVAVRDLTLRYQPEGPPALDGIGFALPAGRITTVLGPSGSGKSTLLALLAGTATPTAGAVLIDGNDAAGRSPAERGVALVLQRPYLFPYLSVADNVAFGLAARGVARQDRRAVAGEWLERVGLPDVGRRRPSQLSGGQQQRVALARALATEPRLLLLDEPFAGLDPSLRQEMAHQLRALVEHTGVTTVMVTHDLPEAMSLGHTTVLLDHGRLVGAGPSQAMFTRPPTRAAAVLMGITLFLAGSVEDQVLTLPAGVELHLPAGSADAQQATYAIRPEHVRVVAQPGENVLDGSVTRTTFRGEFCEVELATPAGPLIARAGGDHPVGAPCRVELAADDLFPLAAAPVASGERAPQSA